MDKTSVFEVHAIHLISISLLSNEKFLSNVIRNTNRKMVGIINMFIYQYTSAMFYLGGTMSLHWFQCGLRRI